MSENNTNYQKLNSFKFGLAGGFTAVILVILVDIILYFTLLPLYVRLMTTLYGTVGYTSGMLFGLFFVLALVGFIFGFIFAWLLSFIYNRLL